MERIRAFLQKMSKFFTSLFDMTSYSETQKATNDILERISSELGQLKDGQQVCSAKLDCLSSQVATIKEGLQLELFESLQNLHDKLLVRHWASPEEKADAKRYYDEIHQLGQDGWSERYYKEILELPESREELYARL